MTRCKACNYQGFQEIEIHRRRCPVCRGLSREVDPAQALAAARQKAAAAADLDGDFDGDPIDGLCDALAELRAENARLRADLEEARRVLAEASEAVAALMPPVDLPTRSTGRRGDP